jgi:hypothetical protein
MNLAALRENYQKGELLETTVHANPIEQFKIYQREIETELAMTKDQLEV